MRQRWGVVQASMPSGNLQQPVPRGQRHPLESPVGVQVPFAHAGVLAGQIRPHVPQL
jgi:hypothetical protein